MNIEEISIKLLESKLSADQLFYLKLIQESKFEIADAFIEYCYYGREQVDSLIVKGILSDSQTLTEEGEELLSDFVFNSSESISGSVEEWIDEYRDKFKNISVRNRPLTGNRIDCIAKMKKFINKYKYDKDTILKATDNYINRMHGNRTFMQSADYFIIKYSTSNLASECEAMIDGHTPDMKFENTNEFV